MPRQGGLGVLGLALELNELGLGLLKSASSYLELLLGREGGLVRLEASQLVRREVVLGPQSKLLVQSVGYFLRKVWGVEGVELEGDILEYMEKHFGGIAERTNQVTKHALAILQELLDTRHLGAHLLHLDVSVERRLLVAPRASILAVKRVRQRQRGR